jgi:lon-related putative ATP-dependent protease
MPDHFRELSAKELRAFIDPASLPYDHTGAIEPLEKTVVGQKRGIDAIEFGMGMKERGYNIFVAGPAKAGLTYISKTFLEKQAAQEPIPCDWCYVYNFKEPDKPKNLSLSPGKGQGLKKDMENMIETLKNKIPEVFNSDDYQNKEKELRKTFEKKRDAILDDLSKMAREKDFILQFSQVGMFIVPSNAEGEPMSKDTINQMDEEQKKEIRRKSEELQGTMKNAIRLIREAETEFQEKHNKLDNNIALFVVEHYMTTILEKYSDEEDVQEFLKAVQDDIVENIGDFKKLQDEQQQPDLPVPVPVPSSRENLFKKYTVNLLIDNSETKGAPVIIESNPVYPNLFGSVERQAFFGALITDFSMIKPGSLHKANGGYLIIKAMDLLKWYLSYEALKRALDREEIKIEDPGELYGIFSSKTIHPEPIPLNVKIVLTGDPRIYQLLYIYDERFQKFFKVKAHLDDRFDRKEECVVRLIQMMSNFCRDQKIRHVDREGIARILEYSMELTEDHNKFSLELGDISDLLKEANYFASREHHELITGEDIETAIQKRIYRANLIEERIKETVTRDIFWVETEGEKIGQINGLSILMTGDHVFGKPGRITASVSVGKQGVVAIDRESKMSGSTHTKGVIILSNFLRERFAYNKPISLSASLCFEQSYGMIDGDSASSTELYVLLSAISEIPIKQGIAVTGSVSQKGEIQPIGGVTKKIEGFFDICQYKGLTGEQGVIIPEKNRINLMLKQEVIDAVAEEKFHIWPVTRIEEGIQILTGLEAGERQADGNYPENTVFRKVDDRLSELTRIIKEFGKEEEGEKGAKDDEDTDGPVCKK